MNIDAVKRQIEESIPWRDGVLTVEQAFALVAEVERLCAEVERLGGERDAVVDYLCERAEAIRKGEQPRGALELAVIGIERGEHRREEK